MKNIFYILAGIVVFSCEKKLPPVAPDVITKKVVHDTDDPAIWINKEDPSKSIVFGTDKNTDGAIFGFDLEGNILQELTIKNVKYPNNIDLEYDFKLNDSTTVDVIAFTEREKGQIRLFSVPDMVSLDNGGFPVFEDEKDSLMRMPMGIGLYKNPETKSLQAIVSRKNGPLENYLYQYEFRADSSGVKAALVRKFGKFSGKEEIEAVAVDDQLGFVYYSDEGVCIRKYYANPLKGNEELHCFGSENFKEDIEGIAIAVKENNEGYIIVSDQQRGQFNIFSRKDNTFIKAINLSTIETDGCDVVTTPLGNTFKTGLFVAMNDDGTFYFYDLAKLGL
ncbi:phytase [Abyssalbus ytuae]|uniref:Phytase n=1 Tax=Abyssalbus ytuae TaxID=2926907 RepID=A0A9E7CSG3_9FLAO|nr:phytase [Abyssalbus ytuae]UOB16241.1 phytase [Abyssalbus ytuae]